MAKTQHMSVAEVKRRFADVVGMVVHGGMRIIVERRGRPVVAIVPVEDVLAGQGKGLAEALGEGGAEGEEFAKMMRGVVSQRRKRRVRRVRA